MKRTSFLICIFLTTIFSFECFAQQISWTETAAGVWKAVVGKPETYDLLKAAGVSPDTAAIGNITKAVFPFNQADIAATVVDNKTYLRFPLTAAEQVYGFGLNFQTVNQRGRILQLHMDHYAGRDNGRTHAPVPFYISSKGYGVFINSARYITVYAGSAVRRDSREAPPEQDRNTDKNWSSQPYSDAVEILVPAAGAEIYVFGGPGSMDAVRRFNLYNGGGCLPPRWGLGFTQRVKSLYTAAEVEKEADEFAAKGYPLDFIGLEPGWQSKSYPGSFEWDKTRFPDPARFVSDMMQKSIRINLWINPYVSKHAPFYKNILPYTASHMVWNGLVPDFTMDTARKYFFDQVQNDQVGLGVSGYKIDEVDGFDNWLWPDVASFPGGLAAEQMRQTYGVLLQRYSTDIFHKQNRRTYGLVRASNAGAVSFPYVIYNDYYKHEDFITALINSGVSGVLWTPEVRASATAEEWLRRMQTVVFSPMAMINAWASGTKPWSYPEVAAQVKELALLRMQMIPYWYTAFAKYHFEGIPPFRGMCLEDGFYQGAARETLNANLEENPYAVATVKEIKDQYMAGEYLLVAPVFAAGKTRTVILPKGNWYDFYTGALVGNGEIISVTPGRDKIPVFVKDGGIIPMQTASLHAAKAGEQTAIEFRHYGEKNGSFKLYDDDGETFDYEKGAYSWRLVTMEKNKKGQWVGNISKPDKSKPNTVGSTSWKHIMP
ncbi:MAG: TIM-barrel domain-containing protein [Chitinophagaceae bacterium]